jgi:hypothetical protein
MSLSKCIRLLREERVTPHICFRSSGLEGTPLMDALYPPDGATSPLDAKQLLFVIFQVVYTLECLVRVGIMHLSPTLERIILVREEPDPHAATSYHFVDRFGVARTLHVPCYGWCPVLVGFEDSVKHAFDAIAIAGAVVPLKPKFRGEAASSSLMHPTRRFLLGWFSSNMDVSVDTQKFLLELTTAKRGGEDWASAPVGRPFEAALSKLLVLWTRKDDFERERFSLRSAVDPRDLALASKSKGLGPNAEQQLDVTYPSVFPANYPFRLLKQLDQDELSRDVLAPLCEHMDLREEGVSDNCMIMAMCGDGGALPKREGIRSVRQYDMSRLTG